MTGNIILSNATNHYLRKMGKSYLEFSEEEIQIENDMSMMKIELENEKLESNPNITKIDQLQIQVNVLHDKLLDKQKGKRPII